MSSDEHVGQSILPLKPQFPEGLRVLAVDDNVVCLKLLAALLHKCRYKVTTTTKATEALDMLRRNKDNYDIVITDVKMLGMDGFELLEIIGLEMDIPVIMMSANDDTKSVMKGVKHGARDYLLKPVRMEELKNIWQHVIRKNLFDPIKSSIMKGAIYQNSMLSKRQRDKIKEKEDEANTQSDGESCTQKKQRVAWTQKLHQKFVAAVQQLEVDKAVPKKILELMNEPQLTRENVASHLQKYRNLLRKEKKKVITRQESNSYFDSHKMHGYVPNTTDISSNNQRVHAINCISSSGDYGHDHLFPESGRLGSFLMNQEPLFLPLHPQDTLIQPSRLPIQMPDQMQPAVCIPVPGNVPPASLLVAHPQPEFSDLKFHAIHSWRNMVDDYVEVSHPVHSHIAGQSGPSSPHLVGFAPYSCSPSAFNTIVAPFQMPGEPSSQITPVSLRTSLVSPVRSCSPGQHGVGGNMVPSDGRGGLDYRRQTSNLPSDMHGLLTDDFTGNGLTMFVQPLPESSEIDSNGQHNSSGSTDDDLSIMVKQFGNDSAPKL